jgi:hypothetical protein
MCVIIAAYSHIYARCGGILCTMFYVRTALQNILYQIKISSDRHHQTVSFMLSYIHDCQSLLKNIRKSNQNCQHNENATRAVEY